MGGTNRKRQDLTTSGKYLRYVKYLCRNGRLMEALTLAQAGIKRFADEAETEDYLRLQLYRAYITFEQGDSETLLAAGLKVIQANKDDWPRLKAENCRCLGLYWRQLQDLDNAQRFFKQALSIYEELGDGEGIIQVRIDLGSLYRECNLWLLAAKHIQTALVKTVDLKDCQYLFISACLELARVKNDQEENSPAIDYLYSVLWETESGDFPRLRADSCRELARMFCRTGEIEISQQRYREALRLYEKHKYARRAADLKDEFADKFASIES